MKHITIRLQALEEKILGTGTIPVLLVEEIEPGVFAFDRNTYDQRQLDEFCAEHRVETLIIDDL